MRVLSSGRVRLGFLLGKRPRPDTPLAEALGLLRGWGDEVAVHLPHEEPGPPSWAGAVDLVVQRGVRPAVLAGPGFAGAELGPRWCDPVEATTRCADRVAVTAALGAAGVPVPSTEVVGTWEAVRTRGGARPVVVKAADGTAGRGAGVVVAAPGALPDGEPFAGPWVVQDHVPGDGRDRKLYVAGHHVRGLLKAPPASVPSPPAEPSTPAPELAGLAGAVGAALGLSVLGVDVIEGPEGPVVVDVNPFPGFRGVAGAGAIIACHLHGLATGLDHPRCRCVDPG